MEIIRYSNLNEQQKKIVDDESWEYRWNGVQLGFGLDKLVYDKDPFIRQSIARIGYGLDVLAEDKNNWVLQAVGKYLDKNRYNTINDWIINNPDKCILLNESIQKYSYSVKEYFTFQQSKNGFKEISLPKAEELISEGGLSINQLGQIDLVETVYFIDDLLEKECTLLLSEDIKSVRYDIKQSEYYLLIQKLEDVTSVLNEYDNEELFLRDTLITFYNKKDENDFIRIDSNKIKFLSQLFLFGSLYSDEGKYLYIEKENQNLEEFKKENDKDLIFDEFETDEDEMGL